MAALTLMVMVFPHLLQDGALTVGPMHSQAILPNGPTSMKMVLVTIMQTELGSTDLRTGSVFSSLVPLIRMHVQCNPVQVGKMESLDVLTLMVTDGGMCKTYSLESQHNGPMLMVMAMETINLVSIQTVA